MAQRASSTEQTGAGGISGAISSFVAIGWGPMENTRHDLGTDLVIWVRDARLFDLGLIVGAQVKAGGSRFNGPEYDENGAVVGWWYREGDRSHFDAWAASSVPHLLVLHDLSDGTSYWVHVTSEAIVSTGKGAKIMVPKRNTVDSEHLRELIEVAASIRSKASWEGSAWADEMPVAPESLWRYALIAPRLIAPHPNAGTSAGLSEPGALAMVTQVRLRQLQNLCDEIEKVPRLSEAEEDDKWGWRLVGSFCRYLLKEEVEPLLARIDEAPDPASHTAATVVGTSALLDRAHPDQALGLLEVAIAGDQAAPIDHAWLQMQKARICAEIGRVEEARETAIELLPIGAIAGEDITATVLAGAAAALIFNTSAWGNKDLKEVIAAGDTIAGWWRTQMLSWGLGALTERTFSLWTQDSSVTIGAEDAVDRHLTAASLIANHAADHGGWRHSRGLLGRDGLMRLDRHGDASDAAAGLGLLRISGDSKAIKHAVAKLATDGPARALTLAGAEIHLEDSTRTAALADLTFLQRAGDLLDPETAKRNVAWLLEAIKDPSGFADRTTPSFLLELQMIETLAGVLPAADDESWQAVIICLLNLPEQGDQLVATAWAQVARALAEEAWSEGQAREIGRSADAHNFALQMPLLGIASRHDPVVRERLRGEVEGGSVRALAALGSVTDLPSDIVASLIPKVAEEVRGQVADAHRGTYGIGDDVARTLALLNIWHATHTEWDPLYEHLADPAVMADHKRGAITLLGSVPEKLSTEVKQRLGSIAATIASTGDQAISPFSDGPGLVGACVKLALAFGALEESEGREQLLELLAGAETERRWAAHAIAARSDPTECPLLIGLLQDADPNVRATAAGALAQRIARGEADDLGIRALLRALDDPGTWVPASVIGTLEAEAELSPEAEGIVDRLLSHPSAHVRACAARRAPERVT